MPGGRSVSRIGGAPANASLRIKLSGGGGGYAPYEPLGAPALEPYYEPWCEPLQPHNQPQQPIDYRVYPDPRPACSYGGSGGWGATDVYAARQLPRWQQGRLTVTVQSSGAAPPPWQQQKQGYSQAPLPWQQQEQGQAPSPWQQEHAAATVPSNPPWRNENQQQPQQQVPAPWQHTGAPPPWQAVPSTSGAGSSSSTIPPGAAPAPLPVVPAAANTQQGSSRGKQSNATKVRLPTPPPDVHAQAYKQRAQQQHQQAQQQAQQQQQAAPRQNPAVLRQKPVLVQQAQQARQAQKQQVQQQQQKEQQAQQREAALEVSSGGGSPWREPLSPPPRAAAKQQKAPPGRLSVGSAAATPAAASPLLADYTPMLPPAAAKATPLLADYTPVPPQTGSGSQVQPASSARTSSSAGASPVVPDFIQRLWQEKEVQQGAQQAKQAQQDPATPDALHSARPGSAAAPAAAVQPPAKLAAAAAPARAAAGATPTAAAASAAAERDGDVEEGELVGECASSCSREPWREALPPPPPPPPRNTQSAGSQQCSYSSSSRGGGASQARRRDNSRERYGSPGRGRQASRHSGYSRRSRPSRSSSRSSSRGRRSSSSECESRRRGARNRGYRRRRRSRSPLRRVGRGDACGKRRAAAAAAPPPADAPLALASLVESMAAEAASLQRQLGRLTMSDAAGADGKAAPAASGSSAGAAQAASASGATSQGAAAAAKAADVESQLAALSSKLGQLTLCLQTMQQQPAAAAGSEAGQGDRSSDSEAGRFYIVFDTNVFMDHARMIKHDCWKAIVASGSSTTRILVPLEVVRELDGIKKCFFRGFWAQRAIRRLEGMQGHPALRGQREDERYRGLLRRNDDGILDCCLLFRSRGAQVQLVSKDVNLRVRARTEGIPCCLPADVLPLLRDRLDLEALRSATPAS